MRDAITPMPMAEAITSAPGNRTAAALSALGLIPETGRTGPIRRAKLSSKSVAPDLDSSNKFKVSGASASGFSVNHVQVEKCESDQREDSVRESSSGCSSDVAFASLAVSRAPSSCSSGDSRNSREGILRIRNSGTGRGYAPPADRRPKALHFVPAWRLGPGLASAAVPARHGFGAARATSKPGTVSAARWEVGPRARGGEIGGGIQPENRVEGRPATRSETGAENHPADAPDIRAGGVEIRTCGYALRLRLGVSGFKRSHVRKPKRAGISSSMAKSHSGIDTNGALRRTGTRKNHDATQSAARNFISGETRAGLAMSANIRRPKYFGISGLFEGSIRAAASIRACDRVFSNFYETSNFHETPRSGEISPAIGLAFAPMRKAKHAGTSSLDSKGHCVAGISAPFGVTAIFWKLKSNGFFGRSRRPQKPIRTGELFSTSSQNEKSRCAAGTFAPFRGGAIFGPLKFREFFGPAGEGEKHIRRGEVFDTSCPEPQIAGLLGPRAAPYQGVRKTFIFFEFFGRIIGSFGASIYIQVSKRFGISCLGTPGDFSAFFVSEGFAARPFSAVNFAECLTEINARKLPDFSKVISRPASSESITGINAGTLPDLAIPGLSESITGINAQSSRESAPINSRESFAGINVRGGDSPFEETRLADSSIRAFPVRISRTAPPRIAAVCAGLRVRNCARRRESHPDTVATPRYRIDSMMAVKSESTVNPRPRANTEWAATDPRVSTRPRATTRAAESPAANTVRSAMNKIAIRSSTSRSIAIASAKAPRRGVPLNTAERARHEAELAAAGAADRQALAEKAKRKGMKRRQVRAPDGSVQEVWSFASSFHAMGFQDHQIAAAERLAADWQTAYRALRAQTYEPAVDGGRPPHGPHLAQVAAQARLAACKQYVGPRAYDIAVAVAIYGATAREIHALGGKEHRTVKSDMDVAFNALDAFYANTRRKDRTWTAVEEFIRTRAAMIREAER